MNSKAPVWLSQTARDYWKKWTPALQRDGIMHDGNAELVASLCEHYAAYRESLTHLREQGRVITAHTGAVKTNPWCAIEKQSWEMFCRGFRELGVNVKAEGPTEDALEDFLGQEGK
jgi:P27 family predicted phage terminase small subunit